MSQELNIIGDIAGNYKTLRALLDQMPKTAIPVSVGDMVDRGPRSKEVLEFIKENGLAIMGNHEHMMIDYFTRQSKGLPGYYDRGIWSYNGGDTTLNSFRYKEKDENDEEIWSKEVLVDEELIEWMANLPLYIKIEPTESTAGLIITHGPIRGDFRLEQCLDPSHGFSRAYYDEWKELNPGMKAKSPDDCVLWHRGMNRRKFKDDYLQVHGHNAINEPRWFSDEKGKYAINIDTSRAQILTGLHYPSLELFQQEYID